jgi:hypothetical protein
MNDFDSVLELRLKHLLDPVVATVPPARRGRSLRRPVLTVESTGIELVVEAIPVVIEPVVAPAR